MRSLDTFLPTYDFSTRHQVSIAVEPARADRALREVTFKEVPVVRGLLLARGLGLRRAEETVLATMVPRATVLEDVPGEGLILTLSGRFWRVRGRGPDPPATAVIDFRALPGSLATELKKLEALGGGSGDADNAAKNSGFADQNSGLGPPGTTLGGNDTTINGAATMLGNERAAAFAADLLDTPPLRGTSTRRAEGRFQRRSCCLIYLAAAEPNRRAVCGDCVLMP